MTSTIAVHCSSGAHPFRDLELIMCLTAQAQIELHLSGDASKYVDPNFWQTVVVSESQSRFLRKTGFPSLLEWWNALSPILEISICPTWAEIYGVDDEQYTFLGTPQWFAELAQRGVGLPVVL